MVCLMKFQIVWKKKEKKRKENYPKLPWDNKDLFKMCPFGYVTPAQFQSLSNVTPHI